MTDDLYEFGSQHTCQCFHGFRRIEVGIIEHMGLDQLSGGNGSPGTIDDGVGQSFLSYLDDRRHLAGQCLELFFIFIIHILSPYLRYSNSME